MADSGKLTDPHLDETASQAFDVAASSIEAPLPFSVSQMTTCRSSFEDDIRHWQEAGLTAIGLWRRKFDACGEAESLELLRASELDVTTVSFAGGFTGSQGIEFQDALDDAWQAVFTAASVGARTLVIAPGSRGRYTDRHELRVIVKAIRELAIGADELGINLAVLPMAAQFAHRWTTLHSLDAAWDLVNRVGRDNVGMVYDTFHFGHDRELLKRLPRFSSAISVVQVSDTMPSPQNCYDRCLPGDGSVPLAEIMTTLIDSGFQGDIDIQLWSSDVWGKAPLDVLTACRERMQDLLTNSGCREQQSVSA